MKFLKKYHKWIGFLIALMLVFFAISGIILNHRELFSWAEVNRSLMPQEYRYDNWNNAAIKGMVKTGPGIGVIYGNAGAWMTDMQFSTFQDFNQGFPAGIDNRKISSMLLTSRGELFAGTYFGLYRREPSEHAWKKVGIPAHRKRIVAMVEREGELLVMTRDHLLVSSDHREFRHVNMPPPADDDDQASLFKTIWFIHSGEILGGPGKLVVDGIGLVFTFLVVSGLVIFVNGYLLRSKRLKRPNQLRAKRHVKWNIKWHNKFGWVPFVLLIVTAGTGMFLRPPLLIPIANARVGKIPGSEFDSDNPWLDRFRALIYDEELGRLLIGTTSGIYTSDDGLRTPLHPLPATPPISVMGINVFEKVGTGEYLVGSFSGLFRWKPDQGAIFDHVQNQPYRAAVRRGPPIGSMVVSGLTRNHLGQDIVFTYDQGAINIQGDEAFPPMPPEIQRQPMSLWNFMLEVHTGRIFEPIFGGFYILIVPLLGLTTLFVLATGFIMWFKRWARKKRYRVTT